MRDDDEFLLQNHHLNKAQEDETAAADAEVTEINATSSSVAVSQTLTENSLYPQVSTSVMKLPPYIPPSLTVTNCATPPLVNLVDNNNAESSNTVTSKLPVTQTLISNSIGAIPDSYQSSSLYASSGINSNSKFTSTKPTTIDIEDEASNDNVPSNDINLESNNGPNSVLDADDSTIIVEDSVDNNEKIEVVQENSLVTVDQNKDDIAEEKDPISIEEVTEIDEGEVKNDLDTEIIVEDQSQQEASDESHEIEEEVTDTPEEITPSTNSRSRGRGRSKSGGRGRSSGCAKTPTSSRSSPQKRPQPRTTRRGRRRKTPRFTVDPEDHSGNLFSFYFNIL